MLTFSIITSTVKLISQTTDNLHVIGPTVNVNVLSAKCFGKIQNAAGSGVLSVDKVLFCLFTARSLFS